MTLNTWAKCLRISWEIGTEPQCGNFEFFCITQILREIKFVHFGSAESTIFAHLEALIFYVYDFFHFLKAGIYQINR